MPQMIVRKKTNVDRYHITSGGMAPPDPVRLHDKKGLEATLFGAITRDAQVRETTFELDRHPQGLDGACTSVDRSEAELVALGFVGGTQRAREDGALPRLEQAGKLAPHRGACGDAVGRGVAVHDHALVYDEDRIGKCLECWEQAKTDAALKQRILKDGLRRAAGTK